MLKSLLSWLNKHRRITVFVLLIVFLTAVSIAYYVYTTYEEKKNYITVLQYIDAVKKGDVKKISALSAIDKAYEEALLNTRTFKNLVNCEISIIGADKDGNIYLHFYIPEGDLSDWYEKHENWKFKAENKKVIVAEFISYEENDKSIREMIMKDKKDIERILERETLLESIKGGALSIKGRKEVAKETVSKFMDLILEGKNQMALDYIWEEGLDDTYLITWYVVRAYQIQNVTEGGVVTVDITFASQAGTDLHKTYKFIVKNGKIVSISSN